MKKTLTHSAKLTALSLITLSPLSLALIPPVFTYEAELFDNAGGTFADGQASAVSTYSVNGDTAINFVNRGDYIEFENIHTIKGSNTFWFNIGTSMPSGTEIEILQQRNGEWISLSRTEVPQGHWDNFETLYVDSPIFMEGSNKLRIRASGANDWQWNLDSFTFYPNSWPSYISYPNAPLYLEPLVSELITIEAESFTQTGGNYGGFNTYTTNGISGINFNQTGDWAEYQVTIPQAGSYRFDAFIGTPLNDTGFQLEINGEHKGELNIHNNGSWDTFRGIALNKVLHLETGEYTFKISSNGTSPTTWEWNADRFELVLIQQKDYGQPGLCQGTPCPPTPPTPTPTPIPEAIEGPNQTWGSGTPPIPTPAPTQN